MTQVEWEMFLNKFPEYKQVVLNEMVKQYIRLGFWASQARETVWKLFTEVEDN